MTWAARAVQGRDEAAMQPSDEALVQQVVAGDMHALEELIDRYEQPLFAFLYRLTADYHTAEDLVQETFLKVWHYRNNYNSRYQFRTWLFTIAKRLAISENRHPHREWIFLEEMEPADEGEEEDDYYDARWEQEMPEGWEAPSAEKEVSRRMLQEAVWEALQRLPLPQRTAMILRYCEELPFRDIAKIMHCSEAAAKMLAMRGRRKLRRLLEPWWREKA